VQGRLSFVSTQILKDVTMKKNTTFKNYSSVPLNRHHNQILSEMRNKRGAKYAREWKIRFIRAGLGMTPETLTKARASGFVSMS
jgi:hypothetical protein